MRALIAASSLALFGAIVLVFWGVRGGSLLLLVVGAGSLICTIALGVGAFWANARARTIVLIDADEITVIRGGRPRTLQWAGVQQATLSGPRLTLHAKNRGSSLAIINPQPTRNLLFDSMVDAIQARLSSHS